MQSSNLSEARAMRDSYPTEAQREAFSAGYNNAHGIACHNVPKIGERYFIEGEGHFHVESLDDAIEAHELLCYLAEEHSRCFSPWEFVAKEINSLEDENEVEYCWQAYDDGVAAAISHDLAGYGPEDYT